jgi:WD40 repeat protein
MQILRGHRVTRAINALTFSPDSRWLFSASSGDTVRRWRLDTGTSDVLGRCSSPFVSLSPTGDRLAFGGFTDVQVLDLSRISSRPLSIATHGLYPAALFSRDGTTLVVAGGEVRLHHATTGREKKTWLGPSHAWRCLSADASGALIASTDCVFGAWEIGRAYLYPIHLWRYPGGQLLREFTEPTYEVSCLALSPDGRWLAAASGPTLWAWASATGQVVLRHQPDTRHFKGVAFSPDSRWLAAAHHDERVRLYPVPGWTEQETFDWQIGPIVSVGFAPDGMRAAAGSKRGLIVVWDIDP